MKGQSALEALLVIAIILIAFAGVFAVAVSHSRESKNVAESLSLLQDCEDVANAVYGSLISGPGTTISRKINGNVSSAGGVLILNKENRSAPCRFLGVVEIIKGEGFVSISNNNGSMVMS